MTTKRLFATIAASLAAVFFCAAPQVTTAQAQPSALSGVASSQEEGPMEGVVVSAKKTGSTITTTVVTDAQGRYSFPQSRLDAGQYAVRVRSVGYEMQNPGPVDVPGKLDLKLTKTKDLS